MCVCDSINNRYSFFGKAKLFFRFFTFFVHWFIAKTYLNLAKNYSLDAFSKRPICFRLEQTSVIKFSLTEKCKPCDIYRRIVGCVQSSVLKSKRTLYK